MPELFSLVPAELTTWLLRLTEQTPEPEEVKAGWTALVVFLLLGAAVVVLGFSLTKQLRRAEAAKRAGVYGDEPETDAPGGALPSEDFPSGEAGETRAVSPGDDPHAR